MLTIIDEAMRMTRERLAASPDYGVYIHAHEQLQLINSAVVSERAISFDLIKIDIGLMAAKELDATDPEYADKLCLVDYLCKKMFS